MRIDPKAAITALLLASLPATLPATAARAELRIQLKFTEKQARSQGLSRSNDTCSTTYEVKTLGRLLFVETVRSNCRTFKLDDVQGVDGSASALVFEGRSSRQTRKCTYRARSHTESCSDGSALRLPDGPDLDYTSRVETRSSYTLGKSGLAMTRQVKRDLTTSQGARQVGEAAMKMAIAIQGNKCQLTELASSSKSQVVEPGRGRALKGAALHETRRLVRSESCKVISR